jgi:DnaJ family protein C protein 13
MEVSVTIRILSKTTELGRGFLFQVWSAYKDQKHDLFLPSNSQSAAAGIAGLIEGSGAVTYALPAPSSRSAVVRLSGSASNPSDDSPGKSPAPPS